MLDSTMERLVLLVLGWRRAARTLTVDAPLPAEARRAPEAYISAQRDRAEEAAAALEAQLIAARQETADTAKILFHKRARLIERMSAERRSAKDINKAAATLTRKFEDCLEHARDCDRLLGMLRGDIETPAPTLPIKRYEAVYNQLREHGSEANAREDAFEPAAQGEAPFHVRVFIWTLRRLDRSDRIALTIAAILCMAVFASGAWYILQWGRVELTVRTLGEDRYQITCYNTTRQSLLLTAPYDKQGLPVDTPPRFGLALTLRDDADAVIPFPLEAVWSFKEQPAHLHGPVVIGPMSQAELYLDVAAYVADETTYHMELTLFRAPHRRYARYTHASTAATKGQDVTEDRR